MQTVVGADLRAAPLEQPHLCFCFYQEFKNLRIILDKNKKNTRWGSAPFGHATRLCHALCEPARNALQIRLAASTMPPNPNGQKQQKHILALYSNTERTEITEASPAGSLIL